MLTSRSHIRQSQPANKPSALHRGQPAGDLFPLPTRDAQTSGTVRQTTRREGGDAVADEPDAAVDAMVARAVVAQRAFAGWSEPRVDALLGDIAQRIADHAEALAAATVAETGIGNAAD